MVKSLITLTATAAVFFILGRVYQKTQDEKKVILMDYEVTLKPKKANSSEMSPNGFKIFDEITNFLADKVISFMNYVSDGAPCDLPTDTTILIIEDIYFDNYDGQCSDQDGISHTDVEIFELQNQMEVQKFTNNGYHQSNQMSQTQESLVRFF